VFDGSLLGSLQSDRQLPLVDCNGMLVNVPPQQPGQAPRAKWSLDDARKFHSASRFADCAGAREHRLNTIKRGTEVRNENWVFSIARKRPTRTPCSLLPIESRLPKLDVAGSWSYRKPVLDGAKPVETRPVQGRSERLFQACSNRCCPSIAKTCSAGRPVDCRGPDTADRSTGPAPIAAQPAPSQSRKKNESVLRMRQSGVQARRYATLAIL
jgi:hypothetical protein